MQEIKKKSKLSKKLNKPKVPAEKVAKPGVLRVDNLPKNFTEKLLGDYFRKYGSVSRVRIMRSKKTGQGNGFGYIKFKNPQDAEGIANKTDILLNKQPLKAEYVPLVKVPKGLFKKGVLAKGKDQGKHPLTDAKIEKEEKFSLTKVENKIRKLQKKLAGLGVDYNITVSKEAKTILPANVSSKKQTDKKIKLETKKSASKESVKQEPAVKEESEESGDSESDETSSIAEVVRKKENGKQSSKNLVQKKKGGGIQKQVVKVNKKEAPVVSKSKKLKMAATELMKVQVVPKVKDEKIKIKSNKNKNKK